MAKFVEEFLFTITSVPYKEGVGTWVTGEGEYGRVRDGDVIEVRSGASVVGRFKTVHAGAIFPPRRGFSSMIQISTEVVRVVEIGHSLWKLKLV